MAMSRRRRRSAQAWGELVKRQEASGLSAQAFCGREQISARVFYRWRARLRARQRAGFGFSDAGITLVWALAL